MRKLIHRRAFAISAGWTALLAPAGLQRFRQEPQSPAVGDRTPVKGPTEAAFERDYEAPSFQPSWKNPQINRQMAQDFVIYGHSDLEMVRKLLEREPGLLNATIDWGAGDFETALGGASHMGRKDIVRFLLGKGARMDLFCAAMMGQLEAVRAMLTLEPALIDARGPHGFTLHHHAQCGQEDAVAVLEYLQSLKPLELKPLPFLQKK